ncbi:hypothetical protein [Bacillus sp. REN3]|uniref:hypothetical protein n=1 Tax=Bacillus sp. REN3 TaxID=2802440 RepID=UPI001AEE9150|nr:hypothetical protein [Bacillus sp. REN3]
MKPVLTCTTEELALLVTFSGYPEVGKGIAESSLGTRSPEVWDSVMQATIHQLILKQLWDYEREAINEAPISVEMENFIKSYVESKWMIRCSHQPEQHIMMIHKVDGDTWLSHLIDRDIMHEFAYITSDELAGHIADYYSFKDIQFKEDLAFHLTEGDFDQLSNPENVEKLAVDTYFLPEEKAAFSQFLKALNAHNWSLNNISIFNLPDLEADPLLANILFFLPSNNGIWIAEYTEAEDTPVHLQLHPRERWEEMLETIHFVTGE